MMAAPDLSKRSHRKRRSFEVIARIRYRWRGSCRLRVGVGIGAELGKLWEGGAASWARILRQGYGTRIRDKDIALSGYRLRFFEAMLQRAIEALGGWQSAGSAVGGARPVSASPAKLSKLLRNRRGAVCRFLSAGGPNPLSSPCQVRSCKVCAPRQADGPHRRVCRRTFARAY
jgi:hypothetical protein